MKYYVVAGEASGDLHASNLIAELYRNDKDAQFRGWGGDKIKENGVELVRHIKDYSFMGFTEVLMNLGTLLKSIAFCKKDILKYDPDVIILIDFPGFNLRIAEFAHKKGYKVVYYISPQIWAWKQSRIKKIKAYVDQMLVILPFEKEFYKKFDYEVEFVGHPLLDAIDYYKKSSVNNQFLADNDLNDKPIIALIPGSRKQEIIRILNIMISVKENFKDFQFVIAGAPSISEEFYKTICPPDSVKIVFNKTYDLLMHSKAALVTSGTATLETALFDVPEVVCYKGSGISYQIAKRLVKIKYISLVNLIMNKPVVVELIQDDLNKANIIASLFEVLYNSDVIKEIKEDYIILKEKLGGSGASYNAAACITKFLDNNIR